MPLPWLRVYRLLKNWLVNPPSGTVDEKTSMVRDFKQNWLTILTATGLLAVVVFAHMHANPHLMFILFYGSPAALVALVVNARWATVFVVLATVITPIVQYDGDPDFRSTFVIVWNFFNRLFLLEIIVLVLSRIRLELVRVSHHAK
jgi:fumarate reductase subunit D